MGTVGGFPVTYGQGAEASSEESTGYNMEKEY